MFVLQTVLLAVKTRTCCVSHSPLTVCLSHQLYIDATEVLKGQEKLDTKSFLPRLVVVFLIHFLCENFGTFYIIVEIIYC